MLNNEIGISYLTNEKLYEEMYNLDYIKKEKDNIINRKDGFNIPAFDKGYIELTDFGKSFCKVCVYDLIINVDFDKNNHI